MSAKGHKPCKGPAENFTSAGRLRKHLAAAIVIKLVALVAIWWCFFRADLRPPANDAAVAKQIFSIERNQ